MLKDLQKFYRLRMILVKKLILFLQELFLLLALVIFEQEQMLMEKMWEHLLNS
jgi:hypothetical protein